MIATMAQADGAMLSGLTGSTPGLRPLKILMVSGAWPPDPCGVGDNTASLSTALEAENLEIVRFKPTTRLRQFRALLSQIKAAGPDIVHIQYPSEGYGRSLNPLLLPICLPIPCVVTIHEYGMYNVRRPRFLPFSFAKALIFTNEFEFRRFKSEIRIMPSMTSIIPIGSAIPVGADSIARLPASVCYFGLIGPGKNIEKFVQLARILQGHAFSFLLIGAFQSRNKTYAEDVTRELESLGAVVHLQKSSDEVAALLRTAAYAYLPFVDGASEKRSSLLAALVNGVRVITPHSAETSTALRRVTLDAQEPEAAAAILMASEDAALRLHADSDSNADQAVRQRFNWSNIARSYRKIYDDVLAARR